MKFSIKKIKKRAKMKKAGNHTASLKFMPKVILV
jgi:hypothetical protein